MTSNDPIDDLVTKVESITLNKKGTFESYDIKGASKKISESKKIIILSGAGISVGAGIPDFRSPKTGLYSKLKKYNVSFLFFNILLASTSSSYIFN